MRLMLKLLIAEDYAEVLHARPPPSIAKAGWTPVGALDTDGAMVPKRSNIASEGSATRRARDHRAIAYAATGSSMRRRIP